MLTTNRDHEALSPLRSLRWRLPLMISALITMLLVSFLWAAYRKIETTLGRAGGERAEAVADQVAGLLGTARSAEQMRQLGADPVLRDYLLTPTDDARDAARKRLAALALGGPRRIELWNDSGARVLEIVIPGPTVRGAAPKTLPPTDRPSAPGIGPLQVAGGVVFCDSVAAIGNDRPVGYLVVRSAFAGNAAAGVISRLVGDDAVIAIGNKTGGLWTNFSELMPAPPIDATHTGIQEFRTAAGEKRLGAAVPIRETPWVAWVEFPRSMVVAPAEVFLRNMLLVTVFFVAGAALLTRLITGRFMRPLLELSSAAQAVAEGDYSRRVAAATRRDEIGRVGDAFNRMTEQIEEGHHRLEARVVERTAELAAARREADRANLAKSAFLSSMSHDLRTPLNAILGFAQLLEQDPTVDRLECSRQILTGGRHLLDLINEVLDITRIESGQLSLSLEPVSVRDVVQHAVELVRPLAAQRGITLTASAVPSNEGVHADRQRLSQVLLNLLSNAVKYNRANGTVSVEVERLQPGRYRIAVADTGAGIPESKVNLLFQPFERLGAEQTAIEGTGLGLALSRALAEAMGGTLGVSSVVDVGSRFWVELAAADYKEEPLPQPEPAANAKGAAISREGVIVYVEDNLSNVRLMERILRQRPGVEIVHAPTGQEGLTVVSRRRPDLVLLDLHLPDMTGEDVLRHLWEDPDSRRVPVVVLTADATPGLARRLKAAGATASLTKPLNVTDVLQLVDSALAERTEAGIHV